MSRGTHFFPFICILAGVTTVFSQTGGCEPASYPRVTLETSEGDIILELYPDTAPVTVDNFLKYVDQGFFNMTIFHRVIPGFMIQGGGFSSGMVKKNTNSPIKNEAGNGLANEKGTIAMARTSDVNSATSQFFINLVDNDFLNHKDNSPQGFGYCVFGKVISGLDIVEKIGRVKTQSAGAYQDVPVKDVMILRAGRYNDKEKKE
ncbi:MAG: peptidyl-prolyl cis-trans isomerase [Spirochaetales bacterium]|nr:peptidyl-prolyl cis-trans isomerase [Spirochaetales bacterium]